MEKVAQLTIFLLKDFGKPLNMKNVYLQSYSDGFTLYNGLYNYFECYNEERFYQSLNYKTPASVYSLRSVA